MKLYDAAFEPLPKSVPGSGWVIALVLAAAAVIAAGVILLVLRKRRKGAGKGKKEGTAEK